MKLIAHDYIKRMLRQDNRFYVIKVGRVVKSQIINLL